MKALFLAIGGAMISTALLAQLPPTLSSTTLQTSDSPLVAAAKRAAAARRPAPEQAAAIVIDDSMVRHCIVPATTQPFSAELIARTYRELARTVTEPPSTWIGSGDDECDQ